MSDSKRQCSKCQFFQIAQLSGNGWCTHPKRQVASDLKILVREKELACRNSWGDDLWVDAASGVAPADVVSPPRNSLFYVTNRVDDEVTSVVDTTSKDRTAPGNTPHDTAADDVVTFNAIRRDEPGRRRSDDHNAPAIADQAERARLMARGNKDAILKARERHAERRRPSRETVTPDQNPPKSDQILAAQDRDHYARERAAADRAPADDYRNTPPVPRAEVEAKGNGLAPAAGTDERFDSLAQLKPEVDLTQLRGFLNRSATPRNGSGGDGRFVTSYDLVLKRAREIKAAGEVEREHHRSTLNGRTASQPAPEPDPDPVSSAHAQSQAPAARSRPGVVWDVEGDRLSIAFERARVAIDQPVQLSPLMLESAVTLDVSRPTTEHQSVPSVMDLDASQPNGFQVVSPADWDDADEQDDLFVEAEDLGDDGYEPADLDRVASAPAPESPRGSWWRSLNFGRKRRYHANAAAAPLDADDDDEGYAEHTYAASATDLNADVDDQDDPFAPEAWYEDEPHQELDDESPIDLIFATSEESWRQDAWEFPEPQPAEWHDTRAQLLESSFSPVPAAAAASPAGQRAESAEEFAALPARELAGVSTSRPAPSSYAFDGPAGMDAFRAALFGDGPSTYSDDHRGYRPIATEDLDVDRGRMAATHLAPSVEPRLAPSPGEGRVAGPATRPSARVERQRPGRSAYGSPASSSHDAFDPDFDIRKAIDDPDEDVAHQFDVASRVPKSCSTCRSFQVSDNGERGWCMNDYSATHRQMVNSDDLACRSSIGDWWLAADSSWIPPADVIQPETPRTDRLVARSGGSRRGRRVRTSKVG